MEYYSEDFYDDSVDEVLDSIKTGIKKEFLEKMESLEKENKELRAVKINMASIRFEHERKLHEVDVEKEKFMKQLKEASLAEVMRLVSEPAYKIDYKNAMVEKCDLCDSKRMVDFTSPSGKVIKGPCDCDKKYRQFFPEVVSIVRLESRRGYDGCNQWVTFTDMSEENERSSVSFRKTYELFVSRKEQYPEVDKNMWQFLFRTEEDAKAYCEYRNVKELADNGIAI